MREGMRRGEGKSNERSDGTVVEKQRPGRAHNGFPEVWPQHGGTLNK